MVKLRLLILLCLAFFTFSIMPHSVLAVGDAWPMYGHDPAHTARSTSNGPNSADLKWSYTADGVISDPLIATNGSIYFTVWRNYYDTSAVALNPDGSLKWQQPITGAEYRNPAIGTNGNLYVISVAQTGDDSLVALDPTNGSQVWSFDIGQSHVIGTDYSHPIVGSDGTIYLASALGKLGYGTVFAVNPNGTQKWAWDTNTSPVSCGTPNLIYCGIESTVALAPNGNLLFKSYSPGLIALVASTGAFVWNTNPGTSDPFDQTFSIGADNTAYTTEGYGRYNFLAVNPNGSVKWTKALGNWNDYAMSALSADGTALYRGDNGGIFYSIFTANGTIRWRFDTGIPGVGFNGTPVLAANGILYFTSMDTTGTPAGSHGYVYAVRADSGTVVWQYEVGFPGSDLAMGADGTLFVPGDSPAQLGTGSVRTLYAFRCADGICALPAHNPIQTVTNLNDSGAGSLRQAVTDASFGDSINFDPSVTGTITFSSPIAISRDLTISGPGISALTLSGNNSTQIFSIDPSIALTISDLTIANGHLTDSFNMGGAIAINGGTLTLNNLVFSNNFASAGGGAVYNGGNLTISNSTFSGNVAGSFSSGGAIYNDSGAILNIQRSTFSANNGNSGGGALLNVGTATIGNSTFSGNFGFSSVSDGGAIDSSGILTVINSTFSDNSLGQFGDGGAIRATGTTTLKNTIIANNPAFGGQCDGTITNGGGNLQFPGNDCGATIPTGDPMLTALADNGGSTFTMALQPGSAAIDAGNNSVCAASPVNNFDQRGVSRPNDGDGNGSALCDVGAFETVYTPQPPTVTNFTPTSGPIGASVTITGTHFTGATAVQFNGTNASTFNVVSATSITATVPVGATTGTISVTTPGGTATSSGSFTVIPSPSITNIAPTSGPVGTSVTITGTNFTGATAVKFHNTSASTFSVDSATSITATVPVGATTGTISVTTPGGTATSSGSFTVIPAPTVTSFTPTSGPVGTSVTISGTNFTGATDVKFNGTSASTFNVDTATSISATVPVGATTGKVSVTTPGGTATSSGNFTVIPAPTITSFTPGSGPIGTSVTISGTNFTGATAVKFNGTSASTFNVVSATSITATVPVGSTTGTVSVTTPGGTATSSGNFTVIPSPSITIFTPTSGPIGTSVTITGTNFGGATAVKFNGTSAITFNVDTTTSIIATVPAGATTGAISVTTPGGTATSSSNFTVIPPPTITSFTPTSGPIGTSVTISGTNFTGATAVQFSGSSPSAFNVVSATSITATVPIGATTGTISVTTPGGIATSSGSFTVTPDSPDAVPPLNYFTTDRPILTWNAVSGAIGYEIEVNADKNFHASPAFHNASIPRDQLYAQTTSLTKGVYFWRVRAIKADGTPGLWSDVQSFTINT